MCEICDDPHGFDFCEEAEEEDETPDLEHPHGYWEAGDY